MSARRIAALCAGLIVVWAAPTEAEPQSAPSTAATPARRADLPPLPARLSVHGASRGGLKPTAPMQLGTVRTLTDRLSPAIMRVEVGKAGDKRSQGTAFFINPEGWAVTNHHVVAGGLRFTVHLADGESRPARVVGRDPVSDFALLYVEPRGGERFPFLRLGDSERLRVGDFCVAMGAPLRLDRTVSLGVISALHRRGSRPESPELDRAFIQFDAAINPGSSGGPLFDIDGAVVGVVTAMRKDGQGLGFAVPIQRLDRVLSRMADGETIQRSHLGVAFQALDEPLAASFGVRSRDGALLQTVEPGSPAAEAGLAPGDIVVAVDGVAVVEAAELVWLVATSDADLPVQLDVVRKGERVRFQVGLTRQTPWTRLSPTPPPAPQPHGICTLPNTPSLAAAFALAAPEGLVVCGVEEGSDAAEAGLQPRMVILAVGDRPVTSAEALHAALDADLAEASVVRLHVLEGRSRRWIAWRRLR